MEAIDKLRTMINWFNYQSEGMNLAFKSIKGLEKAYDYAQKKDLEFIDNDYLYSEVDEKERQTHIKNITKFQNIQ